MKIAGRPIDGTKPPYIVAEISANHGGSLDRCISIMAAAKMAGADACKIQAYHPDSLTLISDRPEFTLHDGLWKGKRLYDLYTYGHTPSGWFPKLFDMARELDITLFASTFDDNSTDYLASLGCSCFKIASFEIVDIPLIQHAAAKGKPMIISTGMASADEIAAAIVATHSPNVALLHCVSGYPAPPEEYNLRSMVDLRGYGLPAGISDHTTGLEIPIAATALGAVIIERHIKLDQMPVLDAEFSLTPEQFAAMTLAVHNTWNAMQPIAKKSEQPQRVMRRSLYVVQDIAIGEQFTRQNIRSIRPGLGMPPARLPQILGKLSCRNLRRGTPLVPEDLIP